MPSLLLLCYLAGVAGGLGHAVCHQCIIAMAFCAFANRFVEMSSSCDVFDSAYFHAALCRL